MTQAIYCSNEWSLPYDSPQSGSSVKTVHACLCIVQGSCGVNRSVQRFHPHILQCGEILQKQHSNLYIHMSFQMHPYITVKFNMYQLSLTSWKTIQPCFNILQHLFIHRKSDQLIGMMWHSLNYFDNMVVYWGLACPLAITKDLLERSTSQKSQCHIHSLLSTKCIVCFGLWPNLIPEQFRQFSQSFL